MSLQFAEKCPPAPVSPFANSGGGTVRTPAAMPQSPDAEAALLRRAVRGDRAAFDVLFVQHKDRVYGCLWNLLDGDTEQIEEAVGTVFLAAFRALPGFRSDAALSTYLFRIAVNEATRRRKARTKIREHEAAPAQDRDGYRIDDDAITTANTDRRLFGANGPEDIALRSEENQLLTRAVRALPEPFRTPVILRYLHDLPAVEVARILGRPAGTVRYQVSRGLDLLRERLQATFFDHS